MNTRCLGPRSLGATLAAFTLLLAGSASAQIAITPNNNGSTLANAVDAASPAVTITSASYTGASAAAGVYTNGPSGISDGIILTSGAATNALPPNNSSGTSTSNGLPGDALCNPLTAPFTSRDASRLDMTFDLAPGFDGISMQLIFGSEEFPEYVGSSYNDAVGVYLNGTQIAFDANGNPITINGPFFSGSQVETPPANGLEYDGSTGLLITRGQATGGSTGNTLTIVVCDAGDTALDSGALLANLQGCVGNSCTGTIPCASTDDDGDGVSACTDCNDSDPNTFPGAPEICDGLDNDCDGLFGADELDNDGDGWASCDGDCDDTDGGVFPGAPEACDGVDNDCNGLLDFPGEDTDGDGDGIVDCADICIGNDASGDSEGDGVCNDIDNCPFEANGGQEDADGDGFGDVCDVCPNDGGNDADGDGSCASDGDCNDADASIFPGAPEACNAIDDDCDGVVPGTEIDDDGDAFAECEGDCNDGSASTYPGAPELCDRADNDCDGVLPGDEVDDDGDAQTECEGDCDDADAANWTGNTEVCDGQDNNCGGDIDEGYPNYDGDAFADCVDPDDDNDGVDDGDDLCAETVLTDDWDAGVPSSGALGSNRWMYDAALDTDGDGSFTQGASGNGKNNGNGQGNNQAAGWTYEDMGGCSCAQIIDELALGNGHTKFGCSNSAMEDWALIVNP